jgi:aspartyl-tRNA(Asn)/glutamyl-tRNA(Gln) amidotransferase subunit B
MNYDAHPKTFTVRALGSAGRRGFTFIVGEFRPRGNQRRRWGEWPRAGLGEPDHPEALDPAAGVAGRRITEYRASGGGARVCYHTGMNWEPVIGLEIHAQLATESKMFCGCPLRPAAPPNTAVCPVCLGLPGALPVLNGRAVDFAVLAALALGCTVSRVSVFARKNYFYPDLPKGYQISQFDRPLATDGALAWTEGGTTTRVGITRLHLEEDAGKSMHVAPGASAGHTSVDFNRSGVPLVEVVTRPDLRSAADAASFFERLRDVLVELGVCGGNLEEGHLRCDANVSVRRVGDERLGTPVEVKNLNSFRYLHRALDHEIARQAAALAGGGVVRHETRLWDVAGARTIVMRSKEEADDYRYFPEPDLPPLVVSAERVARLAALLPELPDARRQRLVASHGLSEYDAGQIAASKGLSDFYEALVAACGRPKTAANWIVGEVARKLNETGRTIERAGVTAGALAGLIAAVDAGTISGSVAKGVFEKMWGSGRSADEVIRSEDLSQIDDEAALAAVVADVVAKNPRAVAQYKAGRTLAFGFFVGQVMKATGGRANPGIVTALVVRELGRA